AGSSPREAFVTVVAAIALMAVLTGLFFFSLGYFRLGSLVRFLPYPVVGGFLAGTGWLLMVGAMGVMVDSLPPLAEIDTLFAADQLFRWLPGVLLGGGILFVLNRSSHSLAMPALVFGSLALFYLVMTLRGLGPAALSEQ